MHHLQTFGIHPNNLPVQLTSLIGRGQEVAYIQHLLGREDVRLLTLTGPGGIGKTRLGFQVAAELSNLFSDGVYFVNLAPISDHELVVPTIAQTLDLKETREQSLLDLLKTFLRDKHLLLLLDNFEQVVSAAVQVVDLLTACSRLKVVVTSRATLHVRGEQEVAVPPLAVPDPKRLPDLVALSQYDAVALFLSRAQAVKPEFQLTTANARTVVDICAHLDGLPLAIELAAARVKLFPPQALLARLDQRLQVLTRGARDAPVRQQSLRNTLAWSYDLLHAEEQRLFRRLSAFVGGCSLEAVEAICAALDGSNRAGAVLEGVASLIDKSLLQQTEQEGEEPRLVMLETIREYGLECLRESGEVHLCQRAHALYSLAFAEEAEPHLKGGQQVLWWQRLEGEQENLRAALGWLIGQEEGELALRLSGALWWFWNIRGYWSDGWHWLEAVLQLPQAQERTARRAKVLGGAGIFAYLLGYPAARSLLEESVTIYTELGDRPSLPLSVGRLGWILLRQNDSTAARTLLEESLQLAREAGDPWILADALRSMGNFMNYSSDFKGARPYSEECVMRYRVLNDHYALSGALLELAEVMMVEVDLAEAEALVQESLALAQELNNRPDIAGALFWLAIVQSLQGEYPQAVALLEQCLALARELGHKHRIGNIQLTLGNILLSWGDLRRAETCAQQSLTLFRELGSKDKTAQVLSLLGEITRIRGDLTQARAICTEAVVLAGETGNHNSLDWSLVSLAMVAAGEGQLKQAARLFGAAVKPWLNLWIIMAPAKRADYERAMESMRTRLGEEGFTEAWAEGRTLTLAQVLVAPEPTMMFTPTQTEPASSPKAPTSATHLDGLTARERDVLHLLAQGLTSAQIADQLVIGVVTVNSHVRSIYSKLGVTSRSAATRYAVEHQLL